MPARKSKAKPAAKRKSVVKARAGAAPKRSRLSGEVFFPSKEVVARATVKDWDKLARRAARDLEGFWADEAKELEWYRP